MLEVVEKDDVVHHLPCGLVDGRLVGHGMLSMTSGDLRTGNRSEPYSGNRQVVSMVSPSSVALILYEHHICNWVDLNCLRVCHGILP